MAKVTTPEFRCAYPNVFKARMNDMSGNEEFSVVALFPKGADISPLKKACEAAMIKKWGADKANWPKGIKTPFRMQEERAKNVGGKQVLPDGYVEGAVFINMKSKVRPGVVGQDVQPILDESQFYSGVWARASVNAYAYDVKGNKGVSFGLGNIQKMRDGDSLGGRSKPEEDFTAVAQEPGTTTDDLFS